MKMKLIVHFHITQSCTQEAPFDFATAIEYYLDWLEIVTQMQKY